MAIRGQRHINVSVQDFGITQISNEHDQHLDQQFCLMAIVL